MKAISRRAGLGETYVRDMIERDSDPRISKLIQVAGALNLNPADLVDESRPTPNFNALAELETLLAEAQTKLVADHEPLHEWPKTLVEIVQNWIRPGQSDPAKPRAPAPKSPAVRPASPRPRASNDEDD